MDAKLIWILCLTVATLANGIVSLIKKKNNPGNYGERIAKLEKGQEDIEDRLERLEDKINGMKG